MVLCDPFSKSVMLKRNVDEVMIRHRINSSLYVYFTTHCGKRTPTHNKRILSPVCLSVRVFIINSPDGHSNFEHFDMF